MSPHKPPGSKLRFKFIKLVGLSICTLGLEACGGPPTHNPTPSSPSLACTQTGQSPVIKIADVHGSPDYIPKNMTLKFLGDCMKVVWCNTTVGSDPVFGSHSIYLNDGKGIQYKSPLLKPQFAVPDQPERDTEHCVTVSFVRQSAVPEPLNTVVVKSLPDVFTVTDPPEVHGKAGHSEAGSLTLQGS
jgi:hypothetical protein